MASETASETVCDTLPPNRGSIRFAIAGSPKKPMPRDVSVMPTWQAER